MALGAAIISGLKIVASWIIKKAIPVAFKFAKTALKGILAFSKAHPVLTSLISGVIVDLADINLIKTKATEAGVSEAEWNKFEKDYNDFKDAVLKDGGKSFVSQVSKEASEPVKSNHSDFWASQNQKISGYNWKSAYEGYIDLFEDLTVHSMGYVLSENQQIFPERIHTMFYNVYDAFYKRLDSVGAKSRETVKMDVEKMFYDNFMAIAELQTYVRINNAKEIRIQGDKAAVAGLLGSAQNLAYITDGDTVGDIKSKQTLIGMRAQRTLQPVTNLPIWNITSSYSDTDGSVISEVDRFNYRDSISNKQYTELLNRCYDDNILSKSALDFINYLFSGVFMDASGEERREAYVFFPQRKEWLDQVTDESTSFKSRIEYYLDDLETTMVSDKAYKPIFLLLGLATGSDRAVSAEYFDDHKGRFARDKASKTINIQPADKDFYMAIANAWFYDFIQVAGNFTAGGSAYEAQIPMLIRPNSWGDVVYMEEFPFIKNSTLIQPYDIYPELRNYAAGKVGSAIKFSGVATLIPMNVCYVDATNTNWRLQGAAHTPLKRLDSAGDLIFLENGVPAQFNKTDFDNVVGFNGNLYNLMQLKRPFAFNPFLTWANVRKINMIDVNPTLAIQQFGDAEATFVNYRQPYSEVKFQDLDTVRDYQYAYLFMDYEALIEISNKLLTQEAFWAIRQ